MATPSRVPARVPPAVAAANKAVEIAKASGCKDCVQLAIGCTSPNLCKKQDCNDPTCPHCHCGTQVCAFCIFGSCNGRTRNHDQLLHAVPKCPKHTPCPQGDGCPKPSKCGYMHDAPAAPPSRPKPTFNPTATAFVPPTGAGRCFDNGDVSDAELDELAAANDFFDDYDIEAQHAQTELEEAKLWNTVAFALLKDLTGKPDHEILDMLRAKAAKMAAAVPAPAAEPATTA